MMTDAPALGKSESNYDGIHMNIGHVTLLKIKYKFKTI